MTFERFILINDRIKLNDCDCKIVILDIIDKENVKIRRFVKESKTFYTKQKVWVQQEDFIVNIKDLINTIVSNYCFYISNPSKIRNTYIFKGKSRLVINYELINDIFYIIGSKGYKNLIFKTTLNKELKVLLAKKSINGTLKQNKLGTVDIFETDDSIIIIGNKKMCCVDGEHLFENLNLKSIDLSEIDFKECDTLLKAFEFAHITKLVLDFNSFPNLNILSYIFIRSTIDILEIHNLDLNSIVHKEDMFFRANINTLVLKNCIFGEYLNMLNDTRVLNNIIINNETIKNYLNEL